MRFPPNHPIMKSFLGVPIRSKGRTLGNLYLTNKKNSPTFTEEDEETMAMFATQAAVAIENARLYEQVQSLAVLEERDRIGKDLHDSTIQSLYALGLNLEDCANIVLESPEEVKERLDLAIDSLNDVVRDIRNYIMDLMPHVLEKKSLTQGVADLLKEFQANSLISVDLKQQIDGSAQLTDEQTVSLLMIAREGLTNVLKHAQARHVELGLSAVEAGIKMWIKDDGIGFEPAAPRSSERQGLKNMSERATAMGWDLDIHSTPGQGTRIELVLPTGPTDTEDRHYTEEILKNTNS